MKYTYLISLFLLFCACSTPQTNLSFKKVNNVTLEAEEFEPTNYLTAYCLMDTKNALKLANTQVQRSAVDALEFVKMGELQKAADLYVELLRTEDTCNFVWKYFPRFYYDQHHQWNNLKKYEIMLDSTSLFMSAFYNQKESAISMQDIDTIPIVINNGIAYIKLVINGKTYWFCVDTGAQNTCVFKDKAQKIGITELVKSSSELAKKYQMDGNSVSGSFTSLPGIWDELKLHNTIFSNWPILILQSKAISVNLLFFNLAQVDGIIGWDILQHFDFTIDYKNKMLILKKPIKKENNNRNLYWYKMPMVKFYVGKENYPLLFIFDSGANGTTFYSSSILESIIGDSKDFIASSEKTYQAHGTATNDFKVIPEITFTNLLDDYATHITVRNCQLIDANNTSYGMFVSGNLGSDYFLTKAVHIDILNGIFEILE